MKSSLLFAALILTAAPATAQRVDQDRSTIVITGVGKVSSTPDLAELAINVRGEGKTPDEATKALADRQEMILAGIAAVDPSMTYETQRIRISSVRGPECSKDRDDEGFLGKGECVIDGYVAIGSLKVQLSSVNDAGTAVGVAGKLGASDADVDDFRLRSTAEAHKAALTLALKNARDQAELIATGAGAKLGPLLKVEDEASQGIRTITDTGGRVVNIGDLATRVPVKIAPGPIETLVTLTVTYAINQ